MPPETSSRLSIRDAAGLACVAALALAIPAAVCRSVQPEPPETTPADAVVDPPAERERVARLNPDWILIGNSMLNSRIEWRHLSEISGRKARRVSQGGTQSALWYLFLKNIVVASRAHPEWVTIFFRDTDLSWPDYRIKGQNEALIGRLLGPSEPEWEAVFARADDDRARADVAVKRFLESALPAEDLNRHARKKLQNAAFDLTDWGADIERGVRRSMLNEVFALDRLRGDMAGEAAATRTDAASAPPPDELPDPGMYDDAPMVLDLSPAVSFLPHFVALAKTHRFKLHFHRIKRRPAPDGSRPDSRLLQAYMTDLRAYLETHGCHLTDESQDRSLGLEMYGNGDHIADEWQLHYTEDFWRRVRPLIGDGPRARSSTDR